MPLIKLTTDEGERLLDADRVLRDSRVYVVEVRRDGAWHRLATVPTESVRAVERLVPGGKEPHWLVEEVRVTAGLSGDVPAVVPGEPQGLRGLFRNGSRGRSAGPARS